MALFTNSIALHIAVSNTFKSTARKFLYKVLIWSASLRQAFTNSYASGLTVSSGIFLLKPKISYLFTKETLIN